MRLQDSHLRALPGRACGRGREPHRNLQNPGETADLALVRALRRLTANYIRNHADEFTTSESGISYRDIAMATGFEDVEDFCGRIVLPDGEDAETLCQHALPAALGVVVRIVFLDRPCVDRHRATLLLEGRFR